MIDVDAESVYEELVSYVDDLGTDELRTLLYLAKRLHLGKRTYGQLDLKSDPRDWKEEIKAEVGDLLVYFAFQELKHQCSALGEIEARALGGESLKRASLARDKVASPLDTAIRSSRLSDTDDTED